jgi:hypothetical protein
MGAFRRGLADRCRLSKNRLVRDKTWRQSCTHSHLKLRLGSKQPISQPATARIQNLPIARPSDRLSSNPITVANMDAAGKVPVKLVKVTRVLGRTGTPIMRKKEIVHKC